MIINGKIWGQTSLIFSKNNVEINRLIIKKNTFCSIHKHMSKYNMFFVEKGLLQIEIWNVDKKNNTICDKTILHPHQSIVIAPRLEHKFLALKDTVAYEICWVELSKDDIYRKSPGGILK